jgi:hypothetical protein
VLSLGRGEPPLNREVRICHRHIDIELAGIRAAVDVQGDPGLPFPAKWRMCSNVHGGLSE